MSDHSLLKGKTIVAISESDHGSSGNIANDVLLSARKAGANVYYANFKNTHGYDYSLTIKEGRIGYLANRVLVRFSGADGFHNKKATALLLEKLKTIKPDLVFLHILHCHYINIEMLFDYLSKENTQVVWTMHDCWSFTGKCVFYSSLDCQKWKSGCGKCPHLSAYPQALFDKTKSLLKRKVSSYKKLGDKLHFVAVSNWVKEEATKSLISGFDIRRIYNGVAQPEKDYSKEASEFADSLNINDKKIVLCAAFPFDDRKGIEDIVRLSNELDKDKYAFVCAGLNKKDAKRLGGNLLPLGTILGRKNMDILYRAADVFLNPSKEETFCLSNIESISNGTPVIGYAVTGCKDTIFNDCGAAVPFHDYDKLKEALISVEKNKDISDRCIEMSKRFSREKMIDEYLTLFQEILF